MDHFERMYDAGGKGSGSSDGRGSSPQGNGIPEEAAGLVKGYLDPSRMRKNGPPDFQFLKSASFEELTRRMQSLDFEMEREIEELRIRYQSKRQPILDAMEAKKRRQQQNF
ncbi:predicted protein [Nematostella vectensis]|uniref:SARAH domain-containing protein n=2 Tax=Nematostella vectensis TaxID=45351 RepID=A7S0A8_NEMVE|nr:predicted protein [Nematostella vectensis]|eukprot:XP_001634907.1 predicted protein [Nematostella vectensis]